MYAVRVEEPGVARLGNRFNRRVRRRVRIVSWILVCLQQGCELVVGKAQFVYIECVLFERSKFCSEQFVVPSSGDPPIAARLGVRPSR